jgi:2-isopropylmalate synthase
MDNPTILIFDTTMRDGEQSPGASMDLHEKVMLAQQLEKLGVDVIEAGFPASSPADFQAVSKVGQAVGTKIAALCRALPNDIQTAAEALKTAKQGRIHIFISTSEIHIKHKLRKAPQEVLAATTACVRLARNLIGDVQWSAEDCTRTDYPFMCRAFEAAIKAGARTVTIADTVGYVVPEELQERIDYLYDHVPGMEKVTLAVHCHNDLGMAVANSLAGLACGVREVQCTVNGIGERAGNAALEEIVMAIKTRPDIYPYTVNINTHELLATSHLVSAITGFQVQPNKAIVGANAFAHEAGIHQDGVLKSAITYEIMTPQSVGAEGSEIVLGRHSGRHGLKSKLAEMGLILSEADLDTAFARFKDLLSQRKYVTEEEIFHHIADGTLVPTVEVSCLRLKHLQYSQNQAGFAMHLVVVTQAQEHPLEGTGKNFQDTLVSLLSTVAPIDFRLIGYHARNFGSGGQALAQVTVQIEGNGRRAHGLYTDADLVMAYTHALLKAINQLVARQQRWTWKDTRTGCPTRPTPQELQQV